MDTSTLIAFFAILLAIFMVASGIFAEEKKPIHKQVGGLEYRCGWVDNPTPANWWLTDKEGIWMIGVQGSRQAEGDLPEFPESKDYWKKTNGSHGYGCACLWVTVDVKEKIVLEIKSGKVLSLAKCRSDKNLNSKKSTKSFLRTIFLGSP